MNRKNGLGMIVSQGAFAWLCSARAEPTIVSIGDAAIVKGPFPASLPFPTTREGDLDFDVSLHYYTVDGTAIGGIDYTPFDGAIVLAAGACCSVAPVVIAPGFGYGPPITFGITIASATGIGQSPAYGVGTVLTAELSPRAVITLDVNGDGRPDFASANYGTNTISIALNTTPSGADAVVFSSLESFAVGGSPVAIFAADLNRDGLPDIVVANNDDGTVSVLMNNTPAGAATATFATQQTFDVGANPRSIRSADLNGDGVPDLLVANGGSQTVSVLANTTPQGASSVTFAARLDLPAGVVPSGIAVADLNADGRPDFAVSNYLDNSIMVFGNTTAPGSSTLSFSPPQTFSTASGPESVAVADINGDGRLDLLSGNDSNDQVSILLNTTIPGSGAFSFASHVDLSSSSTSDIQIADVNADGKPDLLTSGIGGTYVRRNTTALASSFVSFSEPVEVSTKQTFSAALADFNGDGWLDMVVANTPYDSLSVVLNVTPATAAVPSFVLQAFPAAATLSTIASGDFDLDGRRDVVVSDTLDGNVSLLRNISDPNTASPNFDSALSFATGAGPAGVAVADFNGDGFPDLAVADSAASSVSVLFNQTAVGNSTIAFGAAQDFPAGDTPFAIAAADVDGDGRADIAVTTVGDGGVDVLVNTTAPGAVSATFSLAVTLSAGVYPGSIALADLNGDGRPDVVVADRDSNDLSVFINTTTPGSPITFAPASKFSTGSMPGALAIGDFNEDGKPDVVVVNGGDGSLSVLFNVTAPGSSNPSFAPQVAFQTGGSPLSVAVADVNGDSRLDLIVTNDVPQTASVFYNTTQSGAATPSFSAPDAYPINDRSPSIIAFDVDTDGKPDLAAADANNGAISVLMNTQLATSVGNASATGTLLSDGIFTDGFDP